MCHVLPVMAVRCPMFIDWLFWFVWLETCISRGVENGWKWQPLHCFFFHDVPNSIFDVLGNDEICLQVYSRAFISLIHWRSSIKYWIQDTTRCKNWHHFVELHHTYPLQYGIPLRRSGWYHIHDLITSFPLWRKTEAYQDTSNVPFRKQPQLRIDMHAEVGGRFFWEFLERDIKTVGFL